MNVPYVDLLEEPIYWIEKNLNEKVQRKRKVEIKDSLPKHPLVNYHSGPKVSDGIF